MFHHSVNKPYKAVKLCVSIYPLTLALQTIPDSIRRHSSYLWPAAAVRFPPRRQCLTCPDIEEALLADSELLHQHTVIRPVSRLNSELLCMAAVLSLERTAPSIVSVQEDQPHQPRLTYIRLMNLDLLSYFYTSLNFSLLTVMGWIQHNGERQEVHPLWDSPRLQTGNSALKTRLFYEWMTK